MRDWFHILLAASAALAIGCDSGGGSGPVVGGESHFLQICGASDDCPNGLDCLCGVCTLSCSELDDCAALLGDDGTCIDVVSETSDDGLGICAEQDIGGVCLPECDAPGAGPCVDDDGISVATGVQGSVRPIVVPVSETTEAMEGEEGAHLVAFSSVPTTESARAPIVIVFRDPETETNEYVSLLAGFSGLGVHALLIDHDGAPYQGNECNLNEGEEDLTCITEARHEALYGVVSRGDSVNGSVSYAWELFDYLGREYPETWGYTLDDLVDWSAAGIVVVGHANSGPLVMHLARTYPVARAVFLDAPTLDALVEKEELFDELATPRTHTYHLTIRTDDVWDRLGASWLALGIDPDVDFAEITEAPVPDGIRLVHFDAPDGVTSVVRESELNAETIDELFPIWGYMIGTEVQ